MAEQKCCALGHVEATAAADSDHHVRLEILRFRNAGGDAVAGHIRQRSVVDQRVYRRVVQASKNFGELRCRRETLVGTDERAPPISGGNDRQHMALAFAEQNLARQARRCKQGHAQDPSKTDGEPSELASFRRPALTLRVILMRILYKIV